MWSISDPLYSYSNGLNIYPEAWRLPNKICPVDAWKAVYHYNKWQHNSFHGPCSSTQHFQPKISELRKFVDIKRRKKSSLKYSRNKVLIFKIINGSFQLWSKNMGKVHFILYFIVLLCLTSNILWVSNGLPNLYSKIEFQGSTRQKF